MTKFLFIIFVLLSGIFFIKNKKYLLYLYIFFLPFLGLQVDWGLQFDFVKILAFAMFIYVIAFLKFPRKLSPMMNFIAYMIFITGIMSVFLPETANNFPPLRGEYRWIFQIFMWLLIFAPLFYSQIFIKKTETIEKLYKFLLISLLIVSFLGFVQVIVFYSFHFDLFPIGLLGDSDSNRTGMFFWGNIGIFRMSSIGGEPKHLAYSLVMGLTILCSYLINKRFLLGKKLDIFIFIIMFIALFLTFSTQGYILFFLNFMILSIYFKRFKIPIISLIVFIFIVNMMSSFYGMSLNDLIQLRIFREKEVISVTNYTEDWNEAVLGFLKDYPKFLITGTGLGNIHLWAQNYIPDYAIYYMYGNVFCAKSGFLRILSETGIMGIVLFFYAFFKPFCYFKRYNTEIKIHFLIGFLIFLSFLLSMDGPSYITFAFIIVYSLYKLTGESQKNQGRI